MYRFIFLFSFFLAASQASAFAQATDLDRARRIYDYFLAGQGDSIHAALRPDLQGQLPAAAFTGMLGQLEQQFGKLQAAGDWQASEAGGQPVVYRDLDFERGVLRFLVAFDADGTLNTIRLMPAPASPAASLPPGSATVLEREVSTGAPGFPLPGTLTLPRAAVEAGRDVPCVVMVHGSGPNDRDETVGPNKPFRDMAWGLAGQGIASLRYDKRTRVYAAACVPEGRPLDMDVETCDDAVAAVAFAREQPGVAADSIYVLGHSQGGMLAPRIAACAGESVAGVVIVAGPARPLEDILLEQAAYLATLAGSPEADRQLAAARRQVDNVKLLGTPAFCDTIPLPLGLPRSYWEYLHAYDPLAAASSLGCPVLVLQGERDYQVTMQDYGCWHAALAGNRRAQFKSYPALNHLLQEGKGKSTPQEYNEAHPVPAYVWQDIAGFIRGEDIRN